MCEHLGLIICGSQDCRISIWSIDSKKFKIIKNDPEIIYGHTDWVKTLSVNSSLEIFVSSDKKNNVLMFSLKSKKLITKLDLESLQSDETNQINLVKIHDNGLILVILENNVIGLYKYLIFFK